MIQSNQQKNLINKKKIINFFILSTFLSYFFLGLNIYKDFGISIDEPFHRTSGFYWYLWIIDNFFSNYSNLENLRNSYNKMEWSQDFIKGTFIQYGVIFDLFFTFIENKFNINKIQNIYYLKHLFTFFIFFISSLFFFYLIKDRFNDDLLALIGFLFYITSPRIFAESFYNSKDIVFMSFLVFAIFFVFKLLKNYKLKNIILFSFFSALATSVRPLGILIIFLFMLFFIIECVEKKDFKVKRIKFLFFTFLFYLSFTYLLWPYLWSNPINNFIYSFSSFTNYAWGGSVFYFGNYIKADNLPWHYTFVWIVVSMPFIYTLLFMFSSFNILFNFFTNVNSLWKNLNEKLDLFILSFFLLPIFFVILFNSTLYNGWRHLYFIYPAVIYISIYALNFFINLKIKIFLKRSIFFIIFLSIFINISNLVKLHPFQNIYFNFLVEKKANSLFEIDYWGLGNAHALSKILEDIDTNENINIRTASFTPLNYSLYILDNKKIKNINLSGTVKIDSDYIFTNYIYETNPKYNKKYYISENYKKIYTLKRGNVIINEIYKNKY